MRIKEVPEGSKIQCNGATAEVLTHGPMGTRVNVLTVPDKNTGFPIGRQIWSNESVVEMITGEPYTRQKNAYAKIGSKIPLTLF